VLSRTMRAICHRNGCSLLFTSTQHKDQLNKTVTAHTTHNTQRQHTHGAPLTLLSVSPRLPSSQFRTRISHHLLGVEKKIPPQLNHLELVSAPVGSDSFAQIGQAEGGGREEGGDTNLSSVSSVAVVDGWVALCATYFPVKPSDAEVVVNLDEVKLLPEPQVDQLVMQKESNTGQASHCTSHATSFTLSLHLDL
jgi:hypothetical protein